MPPCLRGVWHQGRGLRVKADWENHGTPAIGGQGSAIRESQIVGVYIKSNSNQRDEAKCAFSSCDLPPRTQTAAGGVVSHTGGRVARPCFRALLGALRASLRAFRRRLRGSYLPVVHWASAAARSLLHRDHRHTRPPGPYIAPAQSLVRGTANAVRS